MPIITIASQKGGSGKTTLATALADALTQAGERVLLIDADPQRSALMWSAAAATAVHVIAAAAPMLRRSALAALAASYTWTLIDCPPRMGEATRAAIVAADLVLVPVRPTTADIQALPQVADTIDDRPCVAVINQRPSRSTAADSAPAAITGAGLRLARTTLGFRADFDGAFSVGRGPASYAPSSTAAAEVAALLAEIREEVSRA